MEFQDILYEKQAGTARITINRSDRGNALPTLTLAKMIQALDGRKSFLEKRKPDFRSFRK